MNFAKLQVIYKYVCVCLLLYIFPSFLTEKSKVVNGNSNFPVVYNAKASHAKSFKKEEIAPYCLVSVPRNIHFAGLSGV